MHPPHDVLTYLIHLRLPLAADDVDPDVPVGDDAHALEEEVVAVEDELVGHPGHARRLVEHRLLVDVHVARDQVVGAVPADAVAALPGAVVLGL